ncbi:hypothetical protein ACPV5S_17315, partial [Vibrio astriarenae]
CMSRIRGPYVRFCERDEAVTPHPTRFSGLISIGEALSAEFAINLPFTSQTNKATMNPRRIGSLLVFYPHRQSI